MSHYRTIITVISTLVIALSNTSNLYASTNNYSGLLKDFAEKKAEVVHVDNGTAYVNIGDESNIRVGELFVLTEEQKLQGINDSEKPFSVKKNIGIYRVMQSKTNFSLIRAVNTDREISVGDTVILNHNLKAVFIDTTGRSESTFVELRKALPNLIWLNYKAVKSEAEIKNFISKSEAEADLFIIAKENTINVRDRDQQLIYGYSIPVEPLVTKHTPNVSNAPLPFLANLHRKYLGSVNKRITASDFVAYDDKAYILATDGASLSVYSIENSLNVIAVLDDDFPGTIISVKWWVPNSAALPKAVVSVWKNKQLSHQDMLLESYILTFDQLKLTVERRNIPYILSSFDLNNDGTFNFNDNIADLDDFLSIVTGLRFDDATPTDSAFIGSRRMTQAGNEIRSVDTNTGDTATTGRTSWREIN